MNLKDFRYIFNIENNIEEIIANEANLQKINYIFLNGIKINYEIFSSKIIKKYINILLSPKGNKLR